jgi:cobyrinic acid a,c-diamide synthase
MNTHSFIVAGGSSGAGKTTITLGLMAVLKRRGLIVQPFKAGPDYIDPSHHGTLCGRPSYNLDTWMMGVEGVRKSFEKVMCGADVGIIEGVMGLFDGKDGKKEEGSTAHLAKVLNLRIILVIDAWGMARSAAALVYGFEKFDSDVKIGGVIFNRVGSERHFIMLREAVESSCNSKVLGYLPRDKEIGIPERHLGLVMSSEVNRGGDSAQIDRIAELTEKFVDIEAILEMSLNSITPNNQMGRAKKRQGTISPRIAIAYDNAFCFYYQENLDILKEFGAEITFFSPMRDRKLPAQTAGIYFGGGYPELHAPSLMANKVLRGEIRHCADMGMPIYAECGGLMYLGKDLITLKGKTFEMVGIFPWTSRMLSNIKSLGYREVTVKKGCPFLKRGRKIRGHEFHYSESTAPEQIECTYLISDGKKDREIEEGYLYRNTLASYVHLHFASNINFAEGFTGKCKEYTGSISGN